MLSFGWLSMLGINVGTTSLQPLRNVVIKWRLCFDFGQNAKFVKYSNNIVWAFIHLCLDIQKYLQMKVATTLSLTFPQRCHNEVLAEYQELEMVQHSLYLRMKVVSNLSRSPLKVASAILSTTEARKSQ